MSVRVVSRSASRVARVAGAVVLVCTLGPVPAWAQQPAGDVELPALQVDWVLPLHDRALDVRAFRPQPLSVQRPARPYQRFYEGHLLPKLNHQFDKMAAFQVLPDAGPELHDYVMFELVTDRAQRRAERGTTKALRDYLLEVTPLGRTVRSIRGGDDDGGGDKSFDVGLATAHGTVKVDLRYRLQNGALRLGLGADGSLELSLKHLRRLTRTRLVAGYDASDDEYGLACRINF